MSNNFSIHRWSKVHLPRLLKEEVYVIDSSDSDDSTYGEEASEWIIPADALGPFDEEGAINLLEQSGRLLFIVSIEGVDPTVDGSETYYTVEGNKEVLDQLAAILAESEDNYEIAGKIKKGTIVNFMIFESLAGDIQFFVVEPNGVEKIKELAKEYSQ